MTRDGYTLHENATGGGWRTEGGNVATQSDLMATAVGHEYGPGSDMPSMGEIGNFLGSFLMLGMFASFLGNGFSSQIERAVDRAIHREGNRLLR